MNQNLFKNLVLTLALAITAATPAWAGPHGIPVSVARFDEQAQHILESCRGFDFTEQNQLRTELERELSLRGLRVLERRDIRQIYNDEFEMPNLDRRKLSKRNRFVAAKYTITGGITELGVCEESTGSGIQLGGIVSLLGGPSVDLGAKKHSAVSKVKLIANVISVETGEVLKSFVAYSQISDGSYAIEGGVYGIGASHSQSSQPPIERAANQAIQELASQIADYVHLRQNLAANEGAGS